MKTLLDTKTDKIENEEALKKKYTESKNFWQYKVLRYLEITEF